MNTVKSLLLKYQHNYKSNRNHQSNGVRNQLIFAQRRKTGDDEGYGKENENRPRRTLDPITCNNCGEKIHYAVNSDCPTKTNITEDAEAFRNMRQEKYPNKPPGGGYLKALVNAKNASCSLVMGAPTEEWGKPPSTGLMFYQTSTQ